MVETAQIIVKIVNINMSNTLLMIILKFGKESGALQSGASYLLQGFEDNVLEVPPADWPRQALAIHKHNKILRQIGFPALYMGHAVTGHTMNLRNM